VISGALLGIALAVGQVKAEPVVYVDECAPFAEVVEGGLKGFKIESYEGWSEDGAKSCTFWLRRKDLLVRVEVVSFRFLLMTRSTEFHEA
jgi:hypothetical protein